MTTGEELHYMLLILHIGVAVSVKNVEVICRARLLYALCDLPAKAALFNIIQFNGQYGCPSCNHPGEQVYFMCLNTCTVCI